ncbi:MAG: MFS transporter [Herpetosiphon sp.]|nr:MFS transporter [Herpetosiphon sp.]
MTTSRHFKRDGATWLIYALFAAFVVVMNLLGPISPFIQAEQQSSYTIRSLHLSMFAVGLIAAGFVSPAMLKRWGHQRTLQVSLIGLMLGLVLFMLGRIAPLTLTAAFCLGMVGALILILAPDMLTTNHPTHQAIAITEVNSLATGCSIFAPLLVGVVATTMLGWRGAIIVMLAVFGGLLLLVRRVSLHGHAHDVAAHGRLTSRFWLYWLLLVLGVAIEFCTLFWGASFLEQRHGIKPSTATMLMSAFLIAMFVGRLGGSYLLRRYHARTLVIGSLIIVLSGALLHWLIPLFAVSVIGLIIAGLGTANLYPLVLSLALQTAPTQTAYASSRASLASGIALLILPFVLGGLADQVGITAAYGMISGIAGTALMLISIIK